MSFEERLGLDEVSPPEGISLSQCENCNKHSVWVDEKMISPLSTPAPSPMEDMPKDIREDFLEASKIVETSPRSATALLRLALQKLIWYFGERGEDTDEGIENLRKK